MLAFKIDNENKRGKVQTVPIPQPKPGEALIRVLRAGVCNTDLEIQMGYMGFQGILGHEFVGVVDSVANAEDIEHSKWIGKRVCGDINLGCKSCGVCDLKSDRSRNHCPNRTVLGILNKDGTMSEYLTLPVCNLHEVPHDVSDEEAIFTEPLAAACRIVEQGLVNPFTDKVAIIGDGKLGLMIAEVIGREYQNALQKNNGETSIHQPILIGKHSHKMNLVGESGIQERLLSECLDEKDQVKQDLRQQFDVVIDATGNPRGLSLSSSLCRPMGTVVLKSTCASGDMFNAAPFVIDELKVVGSRCGPFNKALELLSIKEESGYAQPLRVSKYVTKCFPLKNAEEALRFAAEKSTMKVQIICSTN